MAEKKTTKTDVEAKDETEVRTEADVKVNTGTITYEDHGDHIVEIDNRGETEVRRQLPKSQRDVPVDKATHEELTARLEVEKAAAENEGLDPESVTTEVPPLKEDKGADAEPETVTVTAKGAE